MDRLLVCNTTFSDVNDINLSLLFFAFCCGKNEKDPLMLFQAESSSDTEEFKDVQACLVEVKMKLESKSLPT